MPPRSKIDQLPKELRAELDKRIVAGGFRDYRALANWLKGQGYQIEKSAVHSHGQKLEEKLEAIKEATQAAVAIRDASPDDEGAMNDALVRMVQQNLFSILVDLKVDPKKVSLGSLTKSIADLARASVSQKKWMQEIRDRIAAKVAQAGEQVEAARRAGGLSPDAEKTIRDALLDIRV